MFDRFIPLGLHGAADALGVDIFTVVRLAVVSDRVPADAWAFSSSDVSMLRNFGGIESDFWADVALPRDDDPRRARIRGMLARMAEKGWIGDHGIRSENLLAGLEAAERAALVPVISALIRAGWLRATATPAGRMVSLSQGQLAVVKAAVKGSPIPETILSAWGTD